MEKLAPKVTGLSPMTGPPGTRITVRGENLGLSSDDIVGITINGEDCWPYLEWKSPMKIVTRCARQLGTGDIVITTKSGGIGTSAVQFDCYEETIGLTDESAVWVNEITYATQEKETLGSIPGTNEEFSIDVSSTKFKPHLFLLHHHHDADLSELEEARKVLQSDLASKSDPEVISSSSNRTALLKSNLSTIMDCLQALEQLSRNVSKDNSIDVITESIKQAHTKTHELFDPLLAQKDLVQSIESAMQVFKQNETLFNLPSAIETSIKSKNYDSVVKDISEVLSRLRTSDMDQSLTEKIQKDVTTKIDKLKSTIASQLHEICKSTDSERNTEEIKKLISHLNRLDGLASFDLWVAMKELRDSLFETLDEYFDKFLKLSLEEAKNETQSSVLTMGISDDISMDDPPYIVQFVQSAMKTFNATYYDIIALGQSYFDPKDEFACKETNEIKHERLIEYEELMIAKPILHLCNLLRLSLVPDSSKLEKNSPWPPNETGTYVAWLRHVLQSVIACHIHLTKVNLPSAARAALEDFREFVFELRVRSMQILFVNATRFNKNLHDQENWAIDVDDMHGGRTKLPSIFERNVINTLKFASDTIFKTSLPDEKTILKRVDVQASMKELAHSLINSFLNSLDQALTDTKDYPEESNRLLLACKNSNRVPSKFINRMLITICNCQYTRDQVFIRLQDEFEKLESLKMERVFRVCSAKYSEYSKKISEKFCRIRCNELTKCLKESDGDSLVDLQMNLMMINSQIFLVAPQLVDNLMTLIVSTMQTEVNSNGDQENSTLQL